MREVGYSKHSCTKPTELTKSEGWAELMAEYLPDNKLINVHMEGLDATRTISANVTIKSDDPTVRNKSANGRDVDFIDVPDFAVRHKYLETAYKLKGKLTDAVVDQRTQIIQIELTDETDTKSSTIKNIQGQTQIPDSSGGSEVREDYISLSEDDFGSSK
jgi:hypothetical protein